MPDMVNRNWSLEILHCDLDSMLFVFETNHEQVNQTLERFELNEFGVPTVNKKAYNTLISSWLGGRDLNPDSWSQSPESYH